jgi:hypothetical protein
MIAWIGGLIYQLTILVPAIRKLENIIQAQIIIETSRLFRILSTACIALVLYAEVILSLDKLREGIILTSVFGILLITKYLLTFILVIFEILRGYYILPRIIKLFSLNVMKEKMEKNYKLLVTFGSVNAILGIVIIILISIMSISSSLF